MEKVAASSVCISPNIAIEHDLKHSTAATEALAPQILVEVSPVILFTADEYESHGKHTILDEYTFCWPGRDGTMALALGLGVPFHPRSPISIYLTTTRCRISFQPFCHPEPYVLR
jgi:hypothetical protein